MDDESSGVKTFMKHQIRKRKHEEAQILDSIVRVLCVHADLSYSTATGFVIAGKKLLTNAHSLKNHSKLFLTKVDSSHLFIPTVLAIANECDLALLTVDDEEFWKGVSPVEFGFLPSLGDVVTVVGYPKRLDSACVTGAVVSRIGMISYDTGGGSTELLCLQVHVNTNLQNCGAPAFDDNGQCVGVSLPPLEEDFSDRICSLVPAPVVMHFIDDYEKSKQYTGFPVLGVEWQNMQNAGFRELMGMTPSQEGIRVTRVDPTTSTFRYLEPSDIILKFDGVSIGCDGTVPFFFGGRISLSYLVTQKYTGDSAVLEVLSHSKVHYVNIKLGTHKSNIPSALSDDRKSLSGSQTLLFRPQFQSPLSTMDKSGSVKTFLKHQLKKRKHKEADIQDSIVQVLCVYANDSYSSSSGFLISGRKVLTNAHSVKNYSRLFLRKVDSTDMYVARVLAIGNECDLALLTVDDDKFWEGVSPVEFGSLLTIRDNVTVVGYPKRLDSACVTGAMVSRIDMFSYASGGSMKLLCLQIQVDMNLQNSGAPAFNDNGQCVGVSLPPLKEDFSDQICSLVPAPVVMHFIEDYEKSKEYTGFPVLGFEWQKMPNPTLLKAIGMTPMHEDGGIRVTRVDPTSPASQYLKPSDIILKIDGVSIGCDGTVPFKRLGWISLSYLITQKYTGDTAVFEVLRDSKVHCFNIKLGTHKSNIPLGLIT